MSAIENAIRLALVGNWKYPRYAVAFNRSPLSPTLYWTGAVEDPWTADPSGAMKWADYRAVMDAMRVINIAEPNDSPGRK
jgi:hypothetical protein